MTKELLEAILESAARFWAKVNRAGPDECWPWTARRGQWRYGDFRVGGRRQEAKTLKSHRVAWVLTHGAIPPGLSVLHRCDNPPCCNPSHLHLGTHSQNMADMVTRGRSATGDRSTSRLYPERVARGERSGKTKLTDELVRQIRAEKAGGASYSQLAQRYALSNGTLTAIIKRRTWRHVE